MRTICLIGRPSPAMRRTVELVCWRRRNPSYRSLSAPVSRPGWPGRDRFPCPACWSTSSTRSRCDLCRCVAVTPTRSSSNSPPLNHATGSNPTRPPFAIAPNKSRARSANSCGRRRACSSTRAADPRPRRTCRTPADSRNAPPSAGHGRVPDATAQAPSKVTTARSVSIWRVSPGRSRSGSDNAHFSLSRLRHRRGRPARTRTSRSRCWSNWCGCGTASCRRRSAAAGSPAPARTAATG